MDSFSQWLNDMRWAMNMKRARSFRRKLIFSKRQKFDDALKPMTKNNSIIAYPDAIYNITINDVCRAIIESVKQ